jgi:hypothetical protein
MKDFASSIMCILLTACVREEGCRYSYVATVTGWKPGREREDKYVGRRGKIHCLKKRRAERSRTLARW